MILVGRWGPKVITTVVPPLEEVLKSGVANILGVSILYTHVVFGALEAIYDLVFSPKPEKTGIVAGTVALGGHTLFGYVTVAVFSYTGVFWLGVVLGSIVHLAWNRLILRISS